MNQQHTSTGRTSALFIASVAVTAIVAFIFGSFGLPELFKPNQFHPFSLFLGLLAGLVLAYGFAVFVMRERFREKLLSDAITDPDSGLYTRHYMNEVAPRFVSMHQRDPKAGFAVSLFELVDVEVLFKQYGRRFINTAYLSMATLIMESIRDTDIAVEFGDYRVAVFSNCDGEEQAVKTLQRINAEIDGWKVPVSDHENKNLAVTSVQVVHQLDESLSQVLSRAEETMLKTHGPEMKAAS